MQVGHRPASAFPRPNLDISVQAARFSGKNQESDIQRFEDALIQMADEPAGTEKTAFEELQITDPKGFNTYLKKQFLGRLLLWQLQQPKYRDPNTYKIITRTVQGRTLSFGVRCNGSFLTLMLHPADKIPVLPRFDETQGRTLYPVNTREVLISPFDGKQQSPNRILLNYRFHWDSRPPQNGRWAWE